MKTVIIVSILVLAFVRLSVQQLTDEQKAKLAQDREECIKETKVSPEVVAKADQGDFTDSDESLKCFAKCFYQKAGFINEKGEILTDVIASKIPAGADKEKALAVIELCKKQVGANPCETTYLVHKCYFEENRKAIAAAATTTAPAS